MLYITVKQHMTFKKKACIEFEGEQGIVLVYVITLDPYFGLCTREITRMSIKTRRVLSLLPLLHCPFVNLLFLLDQCHHSPRIFDTNDVLGGGK